MNKWQKEQSERAWKENRWHRYFFDVCKANASMSKDPSTKVGAVIVRPDRTIASTGFNGYPRRCNDDDYQNRERKYQRVIHAEMNAILHAREPLNGYALYCWPLPPCDRCIPHIIQAGITTLVIPPLPDNDRWQKPCLEAQQMALEAGLIVVTHDPDNYNG